ncbi:proteasome activator complex subunit 4 [Trichonephila clavipes]|nr:proteasome activator complex subunit 4 [Trichonephila clavipes]
MGESSEIGFVPQKECVYNHFLPYADKLDGESQKYLVEIKTNLGKAILCQELRDIVSWSNHFAKYVRLYGRKFSKEDHIHFVKVFYELMTVPDIELYFVKKCAMILNSLLKKVDLLTRDDLILPWRPLYELYEKLFCSNFEDLGMVLIPCNLEATMKTLIKTCSPYFSLESTQEILDEFRPFMCPFDSEMGKAMHYFELFFCTTLPPSEHHKGFKLWFEEFISLWQNWHNIPIWENNLLSLFSRLAKDNIGYIDWEPYLPMIFTRLLRSFNLPGRTSMVQVVRSVATFDTTIIATLLASMLGKQSSCQLYISRLFKALESFYHPSNHGRWLVKMQRLLQKLPLAVINRLHRERYLKSSWLAPIPEEYKLTNQEVTDFVNSVVPAALLSMFSKRGCIDSATALQNLGALRPELVIPPILERLYSSLETLTEPHRLTAAMHCIVPVCRPLVLKNKYFPEGPNHVLPLLMAALPGIDSNDIKKCMMTFQFISTLSALVLFKDSSGAANNKDLSENTRELCLATAAFEDFVLQLLDRIFVLIENSCLDNTSRLDRDAERTNPEENFLEVGLYSTFGIIIMQSSPEIHQVVAKKLQTFITSHILEINLSGKYAANMCRVICRVSPELGLPAFLPHFSKLVLALTENDEILEEEKLDDELLFGLLILSEIVRCDGSHLLKYQSNITEVLHMALKLKCKEGYSLGCSLLKHYLKSLVLTYPWDTCSMAEPWTRHSSEELHLYIEDWGKSGDLYDLKVQYHLPSDEEIEVAKTLIETFVVPEVEKLRQWSLKEITLPRDTVHRSLSIIYYGIYGACTSLPLWEEEQILLRDSALPVYRPPTLECGTKDIAVLDGKNVRHYVADALRQTLAHITTSCEDDTKSLFIIIKLYQTLLFNWGIEKEEFDARWKSFSMTKSIMENKLCGQKRHIRSLLIDRVLLQHELRISERYKLYFTNMHQLLMKDLMNLSTSHYSEVRKRAQSVLTDCLNHNGSAYKTILPDILENLQKDPMTCHEEFKGVLYVILGHKLNNLLKMYDWESVSQLLPAIVSSKHSEKPSIIKLLDAISIFLQKNLPYYQINLVFPKPCIDVAKGLWNESHPLPITSCLSDESIQNCSEVLESKNKMRERNYLKLVDSLVDLMKKGSLHWRHYHLAFVMLDILLRIDVRFPTKGVELFVSHLAHDTLAIRKLAIHGLTCILKQQKRKHPKIEIDPIVQNPKNLTLHPSMPVVNEIPDNFWLQYNSADVPDTEEKWNSRHFVHKTHWGFNSWPKSFKVFAPDSEQPKVNRSYEELTQEEKPIYDAFSQQKFIDSIISYFSLEEKKEQDKFDSKKFFLFKAIFKNFGSTFLPLFSDHLHRMVEDQQESVQRCASEIVGGLLSGSKHWDFHSIHHLKGYITPIFEKVVNGVTPETLNDWSTSIASVLTCRDPNKFYWIYEFFMQEPKSIEHGSFLEASWFCLLLHLIAQQEWRVCELLHRALAYILPKLDHSYQNVREKLGSFLVYIFMYDIPVNAKALEYTPKRVPFLESLMPRIALLEANNKDIEENSAEDPPELKSAKNLFRTICRWISLNGSKTLYTAPPDILNVLPVLCHMVNDTADNGFQRDCQVTIAILGQAYLNSESIEASIKILQNISSGSSWHSRVTGAAYLQTMVFNNLFTIMHNKKWTKEIYDMILKLLQDENVEVRESASETLCGFLHCEFFKISDELLNMFKEKCQKKLKKKHSLSGNGPKTFAPEDLLERHAGILGLCACVNAYPYDVPEFLPDILVLLGDHLHDPQPISTTIKKALSSFRRTHHDNWRDHKLKFTDDQLAVITDLLVSPSYYA